MVDAESNEEFTKENSNKEEGYHESSNIRSSSVMRWGLLLISCICGFIGTVGGPLLLRLYFMHGGSRRWLSSWLDMSGFPILFIPLTILYFRRDRTLPNIDFFASRKLLLCAALIGIAQGIGNFMYSYGISFLPVSTICLLVTTQLVFTSFLSFIWVKHKFTPYSINAVVVIIMGSVLLGLTRSSDRPTGVTNSQYLLGFFISVGAAAIFGFVMVSTQVAFKKANQAMTYSIGLQFQVFVAVFATLFCTVGGIINQDFKGMHKEASQFGLGAKTYYWVLISNMVVWQLMFIGRAGIILYTSSLFAGVMTAVFLAFSQIAAVITLHENFTGEKGMALALTLWGFTSYFYGSHRYTRKPKVETP
ncbi:hypothetical protein C5167_024761 [Papaver somniferum]|uniref:Probable purine permease n=1 Tax=Papaver somniferum TaxID=3469 RepID=A0A4Y7JT66_PAPSO|nr:purine permease 3-like [Papaver somniferum]RZC62988.1 hypothetical protein C5167_024761 [Papaver somniferum]